MKTNVIITAAGQSQRYGVKNKLFEPCGTSCVLVEAIKPFLKFDEISRVIVALHPSYSDEFLSALEIARLSEDNRIILTIGGATRTQTVKIALRSIEDDCDFVAIHDGARPFVTKTLVEQTLHGAKQCGASLPLVKLVDALVEVQNGVEPRDRELYRGVQTPAVFEKDRLLRAYSQCEGEFYDDISVVQTYAKGDVKIVEGDNQNIKITTTKDLRTPLTGIGYDIHRMKKGNGIKLLGTFIPCEFSFVAHSDGDVPIHALMDAILTAIGEHDIGHLFPVDDPLYDGANSVELLKQVLARAYDKQYSIVNASISIIAERPLLSPHITQMRVNMSKILQIPAERIGISATTNEQVGELGDCQSIAAFASVLLQPTL